MAPASDVRLSAGEHVAYFYADDDELTRVTAMGLAPALAAGGGAVAIATASHGDALVANLHELGVDVLAAERAGTLVILDAAETLADLLVDGAPDAQRFRDTVGTRLAALAREYQPVHAFGEMVGLLWDAGDVTGAIALEGFWNALLGEVSFSLLCGYRASVLDSGADEPAARVCDAHSASLSALPTLAAAETSRTFPPALTSAAKARGFLAHALAHWGADEQHCADAALIVSELATNAILHAKSAFAVSLGRVAGRVRVAVGDADPTLPRRPDLRVEAASGRGLLLVDAIAAKWGSTPANGGKLVWAELGA